MYNHCPDCGSELEELRDLREYWLRLLRCPSCKYNEFLVVGHPNWIYPLLRLEFGVCSKLLKADESLLLEAVKRIREIVYKTVSIIDFEHTLLGCYDRVCVPFNGTFVKLREASVDSCTVSRAHPSGSI